MGRDPSEFTSFVLSAISIHAPAWGATLFNSVQTITLLISIHAPAWGATFPSGPVYRLCLYFNPRARVGRDLLPCYNSPHYANFNPRARVGRDQYPPTSVHAYDYFNPRARVGRDRPASMHEANHGNFNPRARVGRDPVTYSAHIGC